MSNLEIDKRELRKFALTLFIALEIMGSLILWRKGQIGFIFLGIGAAFLLIGIIEAGFLRPIYRVWMRLAMLMALIMTHLILAVLYYALFSPAALVMRMLGKDPLKLKVANDAGSFWVKRPQGEFKKERYEKMY
ncbi:MAG: SxtJ family membrane protein [Deltaproteobacteria bacterium]|nr:SxtJ family membrane protein [Deltaproteobacteria bacterium]